jgi:hypothetical protein
MNTDALAKRLYVLTCAETAEDVKHAEAAWEAVKGNEALPYVRRMRRAAEAMLADRQVVVDRILEIIGTEKELDGPMPAGLYDRVFVSPEAVADVLRAVVVATKLSILRRVAAAFPSELVP